MIKREPEKILVLSPSQKNSTILSSDFTLLKKTYSDYVTTIQQAKQKISTQGYDIVIIDIQANREACIQLAISASTNNYCNVIVLANPEFYDELLYTTCEFGVLTLKKPIDIDLLRQAIMLSISSRQKLRQIEDKNMNLQKKVNEIKIIARAKCLLIEKLRMNEKDAHKFIEKQAMDMRKSRIEIAQILINTYEN